MLPKSPCALKLTTARLVDTDNILIFNIFSHDFAFPVGVSDDEMVDSDDGWDDRTLLSEDDPDWRQSLFGPRDLAGNVLSSDRLSDTDSEPVPSWGRRPGDDIYSQRAVAELATQKLVPLPRTAPKSRKSTDLLQRNKDAT